MAVAEVVVGDDADQPGPQLVRAEPGLDRAAQQRLGLVGPVPALLHQRPERLAGSVGEGADRLGRGTHRSAALDLRDAGDRLDDRQGPVVALVTVDQRQAVGGRGERVPEPELGPGRPPGHRLPHQLRRVLVGPQQPDDVAADLAHVAVVDPSSQAGRETGPQTCGIRPGQSHPHLVAVDPDLVADHVLLAERAAPVGHPEAPVVPLAGQLVAVEITGREPVALVWAGVVEGEDAVAGPHDAQPVAVDPCQSERADREVRQSSHCFKSHHLR